MTAFLQDRLVNENFLFVCLRRQGLEPQSEEPRHILQGYEIGKDGETCDHWLTVDLTTPADFTATSMFLGAGALYVGMAS